MKDDDMLFEPEESGTKTDRTVEKWAAARGKLASILDEFDRTTDISEVEYSIRRAITDIDMAIVERKAEEDI